MVLTDRQRQDLHAGIYEYLVSRGEGFQECAEAFANADPKSAEKKTNNVGRTPLLEKKWTAIPRLQKKVLELERTVAQSAKIHAHRTGDGGAANGVQRRMLPRLPCSETLQGHQGPVHCVQVHPIFTVVVSGSEDGTIKVSESEMATWFHTMIITCAGRIKFVSRIKVLDHYMAHIPCVPLLISGLGSRKWRLYENSERTHKCCHLFGVRTHW